MKWVKVTKGGQVENIAKSMQIANQMLVIDNFTFGKILYCQRDRTLYFWDKDGNWYFQDVLLTPPEE